MLRAFSSILMVILTSLTLAACDNSQAEENAAGGPPPAAKVTVAEPMRETIGDYREFSGRFEASESVEIKARVSGYLTQAPFKEGGMVKKGDLLFVIDPRPFQAALKKADADVKVAESRIAYTKGNYERAEALFRTGDISAQIRDQRLQERDQALAELDRAKAAREQARLDLSYTRLTAPITGKIGQKAVDVGNFVSGGTGGSTTLATIVATDPIHFVFDLDEPTYIECRKQMAETGHDGVYKVAVALADESDYAHAGETDFIDTTLDSGTGTMRVRALLPNTSGMLAPGMFGRIRVMMGTEREAVMIPSTAILIDQSRKYIYVVNADNTVSAVTVETGATRGDMQVIEKGLSGTERVVISGLQRIRDGASVTTEAPEAGAGQ